LWDYDGKNPMDPNTGMEAKCDEPVTWADFQAAFDTLDGLGYYKKYKNVGVEFALCGNGIIGIDLENCLDPTSNRISAWARNIIRRMASYTEFSPSGTGVRIFARGKLPPGHECKSGQIGVYSDKKFLSVTGRKITAYGAGDGVEDRADALLAWYESVFQGDGNGDASLPPPSPEEEGNRPAVPEVEAPDGWDDWEPDGDDWKPNPHANPRLIEAGRQAAEDVRKKAAQAVPEEEKPVLEEALAVLVELFESSDGPDFPMWVFPPLIRDYIRAGAVSIHCPPDLLAVPLLSIAGTATGRSGRRLLAKEGFLVSSCLWTACFCESSAGKSPALNAVLNFFDERQQQLYEEWTAATEEWERASEEDRKEMEKPGPYPCLKLTDTTMESLRVDLVGGPVLFPRDELGGWSHQMGQYKSGNSDRYEWSSFWSHSPVDVGRKGERVRVKDPFVGVAGMMVPASARELNYRGHSDDGFVHRMLLSRPAFLAPFITGEGVPDELTGAYKAAMTRLFDPPAALGNGLAACLTNPRHLSFEPAAWELYRDWANVELFRKISAETPGWLVSKLRKLSENCLRLCLVLHELWRVAAPDDEPADPDGSDPLDDPDLWKPDPDDPKSLVPDLNHPYWSRPIPFDPDWFMPHHRDYCGERIPFQDRVVDKITVTRAIALIDYFRGHIGAIQALLGSQIDEVDALHAKFKVKGKVTVREVQRASKYKAKDQVLAIFQAWQARGYGQAGDGRANQTVFVFGGED
jgi:hypothetical protein